MSRMVEGTKRLLQVAAVSLLLSATLSAADFLNSVTIDGQVYKQYGMNGQNFETAVEINGAKFNAKVENGILTLSVTDGNLEINTLGETPVGALKKGDIIELSGFIGGNAGFLIGDAGKLYLPPTVKLKAKLVSENAVTLKNFSGEDVICQKDVLVPGIPVGGIAPLTAGSQINTTDMLPGEAMEITMTNASGVVVTVQIVSSLTNETIEVYASSEALLQLNSMNMNAQDVNAVISIEGGSAIVLDQLVSFTIGSTGNLTATTSSNIGTITALYGNATLTITSIINENAEVQTANITSSQSATISTQGFLAGFGTGNENANNASDNNVGASLNTGIDLPSQLAGGTSEDPALKASSVSK